MEYVAFSEAWNILTFGSPYFGNGLQAKIDPDPWDLIVQVAFWICFAMQFIAFSKGWNIPTFGFPYFGNGLQTKINPDSWDLIFQAAFCMRFQLVLQ